jgi:aminoglycoside phosphotransferase (APT) family kinase protein
MRPGAAGELVRQAACRLEEAWQHPVTVGDVLVARPERAVFRTLAPDRSPVIVKASAQQRRAAAEGSVTAAAAAAGLPVPAIVYAADGNPALLVLEYVPGSVLTSGAPRSAWADAGRTLRRVHDLDDRGHLLASVDWATDGAADQGVAEPAARPRRPLREFLPALAARDAALADERGLLDAGQAERLSLLLGGIFGAATEPDRYRVLHGDPQPEHFLLGPEADVAALIDFGDACTGDPVWDLAILALDDPQRLGDVLAGYAPGARLRDRIRAMFGPYRLLRWLAEANWLHERGFDPRQPASALRKALAAPGESRSSAQPRW